MILQMQVIYLKLYRMYSTLLAKLSDFINHDNNKNINVLLNRELKKNYVRRQKRATIPNIKINYIDLQCIDNFIFRR